MWSPTCSKRLVGIKLLDKGIAREGYKVKKDDVEIGEITSGTMSPTLGIAIAMAWIDSAQAEVDTEILIEVRNKTLAAVVVKMPFEQ